MNKGKIEEALAVAWLTATTAVRGWSTMGKMGTRREEDGLGGSGAVGAAAR